MQNFKIGYTHNTSNPLQIELIIDDTTYHKGQSHTGILNINLPVSNKIAEHQLSIYISGKRQLIDNVDETDAALLINQFELDDINIFPLLQGQYHHDNNGFTDLIVDQLRGETEFWFGYDGRVEFRFYSPSCYWLVKDYPY